MSGLSERDTDAISTATRILNEAGYQVTKVGKGTKSGNGVEFRLDVQAPTDAMFFEPQSEAVRDASIDSPEFDMGGNEVQEGGEGP